MLLATAQKLIEKGIAKSDSPQVWADLGAGSGLFTTALASQLLDRSSITAIDKDRVALSSIKMDDRISFKAVVSDFENVSNLPADLDGIIMANALHYVLAQKNYLRDLSSKLKADGRLVLIEYDLTTANRWVPYPISKNKMKTLVLDAEYRSVQFLAETPSSFNRSNIYSCLVLR